MFETEFYHYYYFYNLIIFVFYLQKPNFDINKDKSGTEKTENSYKEKEIVAVNVSTEEKSESGEKIVSVMGILQF